MSHLHLIPVDLQGANAFVTKHHRHHRKVVGAKFCVGITSGTDINGVAIVGRPVSRHLDDGVTLEVTRCCTDGTHNAASMLYGACWRAAKAMGYCRLITYTIHTEPGTSLDAAGFQLDGVSGGGSWSRPTRARVDKYPITAKHRWVKIDVRPSIGMDQGIYQ